MNDIAILLLIMVVGIAFLFFYINFAYLKGLKQFDRFKKIGEDSLTEEEVKIWNEWRKKNE